MNLSLDIQYAADEMESSSPDADQIRFWVKSALKGLCDEAELTVRIVSVSEIQQLNRIYCNKDKPTNVLSFPFEKMAGVDLALLGDVVICAAVVAEEARQQQKALADHWAHIIVHGVLHLLGYDHIDELEAERMESTEIQILQSMNIANPYDEHCL